MVSQGSCGVTGELGVDLLTNPDGGSIIWECMPWDTALHHASQHERANFYFPDNATSANFSFARPRAWRSLFPLPPTSSLTSGQV